MQINCYQPKLRFAFTIITYLITSSVALAAGNWHGPYVGGYLAGGLGSNHASTSIGPVSDTSYFTTSADVNAVSNGASWQDNPQSLLLGIQAGQDWVWKKMVYGVAADYGVMPLSSTNRTDKLFPDNANTYSIYTSMNTNWLFTLRGRFGYQTIAEWPSFVYLTGGMAITKLRVNNSYNDNSALAGRGNNTTAENQIGWTAGAGIELASFGHTTLDLEYLYVRIPSVKATTAISNSAAGFGVPANSLSNPMSTTGDFHASLFKLAVNYRFDE